MFLETLRKIYEKKMKELDDDLIYINSKRNAKELFRYSLILTTIILFLSILLPFIILFSPLPFIGIFVIPKYLANKRRREIEYFLTDALFQASSLSEFVPIEEILKEISEAGYGALSEEFLRAYNEFKTGLSLEDCLKRIIKRNKSKILERSLNILILGYHTGARISDALKETAEDISKTFDLYRQRAAGMTIEKYTLLLAGGVLVPILLGSMLSLVQGLDLSSLSDFGLGLDKNTKDLITENALLGNQIYIVIYAFISSIFVAYQENKIENVLIYVSILLPTSVIFFNLTKGMNILGLF